MHFLDTFCSHSVYLCTSYIMLAKCFLHYIAKRGGKKEYKKKSLKIIKKLLTILASCAILNTVKEINER